jgi:hypothetical protein
MIPEVRKVTQMESKKEPQQWFIHLLAKNFHLFGDKSERLHLKKQRKT